MKGTRLPEDWYPDQPLLTWARGRRSDLDMPDTIESFKDYWLSKSGQGATKVDWRRCFRNWIRNTRGPYWNRPQQPPRPAQTYQPPKASPERKTNVERLGAFLHDMFGKKGSEA